MFAVTDHLGSRLLEQVDATDQVVVALGQHDGTQGRALTLS